MMKMTHCPECNSTIIKFFEPKKRYSCNDCGCRSSDNDQELRKLRIFLSYAHDLNEELVKLIKTDFFNIQTVETRVWVNFGSNFLNGIPRYKLPPKFKIHGSEQIDRGLLNKIIKQR